MTIDSFDSIDSDSCTVVPSPNEGLSPNCSRAGSLSVIPALESFELEEVNSVLHLVHWFAQRLAMSLGLPHTSNMSTCISVSFCVNIKSSGFT